MTKICFFADERGITGFEVTGHSTEHETDQQGKLLCAAISSAVLLAANTITDVIGDRAAVQAEDGHVRLKTEAASRETRAVLEGLRVHLEGLLKQYPNRMKIMTEV